MEKLTYTVKDPGGIHARPAGMLVKAAGGFRATITIEAGERISDCKKLLRVMAMGIRCGEEITITANGEDESEAIEKLKRTIEETGL